jgi:hypothetical protein
VNGVRKTLRWILVKPLPSVVVAGAAGAVALLALVSALNQYRLTVALNDSDPDPYRIQYQKPRFAEAIAEIPADAVVGYVSNLDPAGVRGMVAFFGTQYGIAPRLLLPYEIERAEEFVIGNFSADVQTDAEVKRLTGDGQLELVRDFGAGVALFRKAEVAE